MGGFLPAPLEGRPTRVDLTRHRGAPLAREGTAVVLSARRAGKASRMGTLRFRTADLTPLVEHALAAKEHDAAFKEPAPAGPALWLVHDHGVYLMSNGLPRLEGDNGRSRVVFAEGCDPGKDSAWWETSDALVGGDDFAEVLDESWLRQTRAARDAGEETLSIALTADAVALVRPAPRQPRPGSGA